MEQTGHVKDPATQGRIYILMSKRRLGVENSDSKDLF